MGWFFNDPKPPPEPSYSELGTEVYRLLEESEGGWYYRDITHGRDGCTLTHTKTGICIKFWEDGIRIYQNRYGDGEPSLNYLMTHDDVSRISRRSRQTVKDIERREQYERMKKALERIKPNPFDADCRKLARLVLEGDITAVRPLLDRCMENVMDQ